MNVRGVPLLIAATIWVACGEPETIEENIASLDPSGITPPQPEPLDPQADSTLSKLEAKPPSTAPDQVPEPPFEYSEEEMKGPRIGALVQETYIRAHPRPNSPEIGSLDIGGIAVLADAKPAGHRGCEGGWYAVKPNGFVCHGPNTTLEPDAHPLIQAKKQHRARYSETRPYRWGESRYAPLYQKIPDAKQQQQFEGQLKKHLDQLRNARQSGTTEEEVKTPSRFKGVDIEPSSNAPPSFLENGNWSPWALAHTPSNPRIRYQMVPTRSSIAWTDEFRAEGRDWLLTPQLLLFPKDKVVVKEPSEFTGVFLEKGGPGLPLAFIRREAKVKYRLDGDQVADVAEPLVWVYGSEFTKAPQDERRFVTTDEVWDRLSWVGLTGRARWQGGERYLETKEEGRWILEEDATVIRGRQPVGFELEKGEKWIDISIYRGILVAYEGMEAVFATLISPGLKGYARVEGKPAKNTTPPGVYRIEWKHWTRTMSPDPEKKTYYLSEVPFTQFFHMPYALHGVYWHDDFGEPKSGGCVNLSVADAQWLFGWTEPSLPKGWQSVRSGGWRGQGTWVAIR